MRILIADRSEAAGRQLAQAISQEGDELIVAADETVVLSTMNAEDPPRLVVLDLDLGGFSLLRTVFQRGPEPYIHIIATSRNDDPTTVIEALDQGANDFLPQPVDAPELRARLRVGRRLVQLQDNVVASRDAHREDARHDVLTGALNRRAIGEVLETEWSRSERTGSPLSLVFVDVDHFKAVNDTHTHAVGDQVLVAISARLRAHLRPYDKVARFGGEEFLIVLPNCDGIRAEQVAERLRILIGEDPIHLARASLHVTVSLGVASTDTVSAETAEGLIALADGALYSAKGLGRNRVVAAGRPPREPTRPPTR